ncbi:hypothetical protein ABZP36_023072 [Zizania latifolia]
MATIPGLRIRCCMMEMCFPALQVQACEISCFGGAGCAPSSASAQPCRETPLICSVPPARHFVEQSTSDQMASIAHTNFFRAGGATSKDDLPVLQEKIKTSINSEHMNEAGEMHLYNVWSTLLDTTRDEVPKNSDVPRPPHLENCRLNWERNKEFDSSDEENYPLTRQVQRDIWIHQHPPNCSDPSLRFLFADWERLPGFGLGLLAIAIKEKRILVAGYYNRVDHTGCKGLARSSWSCYFLPERSADCQKRAFELMQSKDTWANVIIKVKENYTSKQIWVGNIPSVWGRPWKYMHLMWFQSEYMCRLLNVPGHSAFGMEAAKLILQMSQIHQRFASSQHACKDGDKACEMEVVGFEKYMELAGHLRERIPSLKNTCLSTEMQASMVVSLQLNSPNIGMSDVIVKAKLYFYFTNVTMAMNEDSLGLETSTIPSSISSWPLKQIAKPCSLSFSSFEERCFGLVCISVAIGHVCTFLAVNFSV